MRIRRRAARLLGSAYSAPAAPPRDAAAPPKLLTPPFYMEPCSAPESRAVGGFATAGPSPGELCEINRSPWDLIAELPLCDPQVEDDLVGKYFIRVPCKASWLLTASMPLASVMEKENLDVGAAGAADEDGTTSQLTQEAPENEAPNKFAVSEEMESEPKKKAEVKEEEKDLQGVNQPSVMKQFVFFFSRL